MSMLRKTNQRLGNVTSFVQIPSVDVELAKTLVGEGCFVPNDIDVVDTSDDERDWVKHGRREYTLADIALLLSHLKAILHAYNAGHDTVLVLEDDAILHDEFFIFHNSYSKRAPPNWQVLQWSTNNDAIIHHSSKLIDDPWISWQPDHHSTIGYTLNRNGMKTILSHTHFSSSNNYYWCIDQPRMVFADEVVYYFLAGRAYTSTFPWIGSGTTLSKGSEHIKEDVSFLESSVSSIGLNRPERVLVLSTCYLNGKDEVFDELTRIRYDAAVMSSWQTVTHWIIMLVVGNFSPRTDLEVLIADLPEYVDIRITRMLAPFDKFVLTADVQKKIAMYDYVLLKDKGMRLSGFPWHSFMAFKGNSVISGPLHQSIEESLARHQEKSKGQGYGFFDSHTWKQIKVPEYVDIEVIPSMFIEHSFALIKADFAVWFFGQVLVPDFMSQSLDSTIDYMWCQAAYDFITDKGLIESHGQRFCSIVPVTILLEGKTTKTAFAGEQRAFTTHLDFFSRNNTFGHWLEGSQEWDLFFRPDVDVKDALHGCSKLSYPPPRNLIDCAQRFLPKTRKSESAILERDLVVYWINLDDSHVRRKRMESMFNERQADLSTGVLTPIRVSAIDINDVDELLRKGLFETNSVKIMEKANEDEEDWQRHARNEYLKGEIASVLSHLYTILKAYDAGHDQVLVLEDDAVLSKNFLITWYKHMQRAPKGWKVLQWSTSNQVVLQQNRHLVGDFWLSWQPDHYGTTGYLINRAGMEEILMHTHLKGVDGRSSWKFAQPGMIVADELLYHSVAGDAYTSTNALIGTTSVASTFGNNHGWQRKIFEASLGPTDIPTREESVMILTNYRITDDTDIHKELAGLKSDVDALSVWHTNVKWIVKVVLTDVGLQPFFDSLAATMPDIVDFSVEINHSPFNKFEFVADTLELMGAYDFVLLKDSDIRLTGFPWNTFMKHAKESTISGALRQAVEESLLSHSNISKRQWYQLYDGQEWKVLGIPEFTSISPVPTMFLEEYFVLMNATFARWYFAQVLTPAYLSQPSDWGMDRMWCAAARAYSVQRKSCVLVPLVAMHDDTKQLAYDKTYFENGHKAVHALCDNPKFNRWCDECDPWARFIENRNVKNVLGRCNMLGLTSHQNLTECLVNFINKRLSHL